MKKSKNYTYPAYPTSKFRGAILDDYQQVAMTMADWSLLSDKVQVTAFHNHFEHENQLATALAGFHIIVLMRERTPFRSSLFSRLPALRLLITTGMRNASVDLAAAAQRRSFRQGPVLL